MGNPLTARDRLHRLFDPGSFVELEGSALPAGADGAVENPERENVIVGYGDIQGKTVFAWSQDGSAMNGTMGLVHARKIVAVAERALHARVPIVGILDSTGRREHDAVSYPQFFSPDAIIYLQVISSGVIPQVSLVMGGCVGEMALSALATDFVLMVDKTSSIAVAPAAESGAPPLPGARAYAKKSGCCDILADSEEDCLAKCRDLIYFLPQNNTDKPRIIDTGDSPDRREEVLATMVPQDSSKVYNMHQLIAHIVDKGIFFETKAHWAGNLITGFARLGGQTTGIVANNPRDRGGCLTLDASDKMSRFVRFCDAFNIPLVWLADTPAFLPAIEEETRGLIRHGSKVIFCNAEATVPQITIVVRKLYGGGGLAMPGIILGGDLIAAWPTMEKGLMGGKGATSIIYRRELEAIKDPAQREQHEKRRADEMDRRQQIAQKEEAQVFLDPRDTRPFLIHLLQALRGRKVETVPKKHENMRL